MRCSSWAKLLCAPAVSSLPHLSLEPVCRRGWGSVDAALARGRIDTERLLPALADRAGVIVPPRETGRRHMARHHKWERELVTQPDSAPPADVARFAS